MPLEKPERKKMEELINKFSRIQKIRQKSLEILIRIDKKAGEYKLGRLKKKLEDLAK